MRFILIVYFLTLFVNLFAQEEMIPNVDSADILPDDTVRTASHENMAASEYVTNVRKWVWRPALGTLTYALLDNHSNVFQINSSTGDVTINNPAAINGSVTQQDTLIYLRYTGSDDGGTDTGILEVRVYENSYAIYLNTDAAGGGDGSFSSPYNSFNDVEGAHIDKTEKGIFIKGSDVNNGSYYLTNTISPHAHPTWISTYGTDRMTFDGTGKLDYHAFLIGYEEEPDSLSKNIYFENLVIQNFERKAFEIYGGLGMCDSIGFYNIRMYDNDQDITESTWNVKTYSYSDTVNTLGTYYFIMNSDIDTCETVAYKPQVGGTELVNVYARITNNLSSGIRPHFKRVEGALIINSSTGIQIRLGQTTVSKFIIDNFSAEGVDITQGDHFTKRIKLPDTVLVKDGIVKNGNNAFYSCGIWYSLSGDGTADSIIWENILIKDNNGGGMEGFRFNAGNNVTVRRCVIDNCDELFDITNSNNLGNIYFNYNIGFDNTLGGIINGSTGVNFYNNIFDAQSITITSSSSITVTNNFFSSSTHETATNIDTDTVSDFGIYFTNRATNNYIPVNNSAIHLEQGTTISGIQLIDYRGTAVPQESSHPIGAYESTATTTIGFNIKETLISGNKKRTLINGNQKQTKLYY